MVQDPATNHFGPTSLLIRSFQVSKMMEVAASLELADRIDDEPRDVHVLAKECRADPAMLLRLCRALSAFGIFTVNSEGQVGQSEGSCWLRQDSSPTLYHAVRY